jgi:hypothetical protein
MTPEIRLENFDTLNYKGRMHAYFPVFPKNNVDAQQTVSTAMNLR